MRTAGPRSLGVEEELLLVDPSTGAPIAVATAALRAYDSGEPGSGGVTTDEPDGGGVEAELQQQQIEIGTPPCRALTEVDEQVRHWRARADALARTAGARVVALATSPLPVQPDPTPDPRYLLMADHFGLTTTEQLTCGCHVHVGVESAAEGVGVLDRIRVWLPTLLALSVNSPFWQGVDSGYASFRSQAWARFPSAGPTPVFGSPAAYEGRVEAMVGSGVLLDRHMVYFDARLSDSYPTVELRVADVCLDPADTVVIAGLARALVDTAAARWAAGEPPPDVPTDLLRLAGWRAGRSGIGADLLDPVTSRPRPAAEVVTQLLDWVGPALTSNGDDVWVSTGVRRIIERGPGATTQRAIAEDTGDLRRLVREAAERTLA